MVATEAALEGEFRHAHSRILENVEEIALYSGSGIESKLLDQSYSCLVRHINKVFKARFYYGIIEDFIIKYFWYVMTNSGAAWDMFFVQRLRFSVLADTKTLVAGRRDLW